MAACLSIEVPLFCEDKPAEIYWRYYGTFLLVLHCDLYLRDQTLWFQTHSTIIKIKSLCDIYDPRFNAYARSCAQSVEHTEFMFYLWSLPTSFSGYLGKAVSTGLLDQHELVEGVSKLLSLLPGLTIAFAEINFKIPWYDIPFSHVHSSKAFRQCHGRWNHVSGDLPRHKHGVELLYWIYVPDAENAPPAKLRHSARPRRSRLFWGIRLGCLNFSSSTPS